MNLDVSFRGISIELGIPIISSFKSQFVDRDIFPTSTMLWTTEKDPNYEPLGDY